MQKSVALITLSLVAAVTYANGGSFVPATTAAATQSGGFYLGAGFGRQTAESSVAMQTANFLTANPTDSINRNFDWAADNVDVHLLAGYQFIFADKFTLAAEVFGAISTFSGDYSQTPTINYTGVGNVPSGNATFRLTGSVGVSVLPGYQITPDTILFSRIGWVNGYFKLNDSLNNGGSVFFGNQAISIGTNKSGLELGLGMDTLISQDFSIRGEYDWEHFQTISVNGAANQHLTLKPNINNFDLSFIYHFYDSLFQNVTTPLLPPGFYMGLGASRDTANFDSKGTFVANNNAIPPSIISFDWATDGFDGDLFAGYNHIFLNSRHTLGAEIFGSLSSMNDDYNQNNTAGITTNANVKLKNSYGISLIPGYLLSNDTTVYLRFGYINSAFSYEDNGNGVLGQPGSGAVLTGIPADISKRRTGVELGAGSLTMLSTHLALREEYDYARYAGLKTNQAVTTNPGIPGTGSVDIRPTQENFSLSLLYFFS